MLIADSTDGSRAGRQKVCEICGGLGFLTHDVPPGHELFGVSFKCQCQRDLLNASQIMALAGISDLGPQYAGLDFNTYDLSWPKQEKHAISLSKAFETCRQFANYPLWPASLSEVIPMLTIMGKTGVGKTGLAACIYNFRQDVACPIYAELDRLGKPYTPGAVFVVVPEMLDWLRGGFDSAELDHNERLDMVCMAPFLILDDLGMERQTDFSAEVLDRIINVRSVGLRPTVVTTNLPVDDLPARIRSRLKAGVLLFIDGEDYRQQCQGISASVFLNAFLRSENAEDN